LAAVPIAHAQSTPDSTRNPGTGDAASYERAKDLFWQATEEYRRADYVRARELFAKAHAVAPGAATFRALGFCDFQLKQYVQSMIELRAALNEPRSFKALAKDQQREVIDMIKQLDPFVGRVVLETKPPQSSVHVDGSPVSERDFWLLVGQHTLLASAPGYGDQTLKLTVAGGDEQHESLALTPIAPPTVATAQHTGTLPVAEAATGTKPALDAHVIAQASHDDDDDDDDAAVDPAAAGRTRAIVGLGVGGAALLTGIVTGSLSVLKTHDEEHHCVDGHCPLDSRSSLSTANTLANIANVTLIVGAIGVGYGLYELLTLPSPRPQRASLHRVRVDVTGNGLILHGEL
jgi:hypothetical protein